jgi:3-deoxy-D-manno-octulosonic-acid transferase
MKAKFRVQLVSYASHWKPRYRWTNKSVFIILSHNGEVTVISRCHGQAQKLYKNPKYVWVHEYAYMSMVAIKGKDLKKMGNFQFIPIRNKSWF